MGDNWSGNCLAGGQIVIPYFMVSPQQTDAVRCVGDAVSSA